MTDEPKTATITAAKPRVSRAAIVAAERGKKIRDAMEAAGVTADSLYERIKEANAKPVTLQRYSDIVNGKTKGSPRTLGQIATGLGLKADAFVVAERPKPIAVLKPATDTKAADFATMLPLIEKSIRPDKDAVLAVASELLEGEAKSLFAFFVHWFNQH